MGSFLAALYAFIKAVPALESILSRFIAWYEAKQVKQIQAENKDAIAKAVETHDQKPIEEAIGNPHAGEASGIPGTHIIDAPPPGVPKSS